MPSVNKSALVPYSTAQMFKLVNDVASYQDFLPWCRSSQVLSQDDDEVKARIEIAHGGLSKAFTTHNRLQANKMIEMRLLEGPFRHLEGFWRFSVLGEDACKVSLDLDFEFSNRLVAMALGPVFHHVTNTLVDAFCQRADDVYGRK